MVNACGAGASVTIDGFVYFRQKKAPLSV